MNLPFFWFFLLGNCLGMISFSSRDHLPLFSALNRPSAVHHGNTITITVQSPMLLPHLGRKIDRGATFTTPFYSLLSLTQRTPTVTIFIHLPNCFLFPFTETTHRRPATHTHTLYLSLFLSLSTDASTTLPSSALHATRSFPSHPHQRPTQGTCCAVVGAINACSNLLVRCRSSSEPHELRLCCFVCCSVVAPAAMLPSPPWFAEFLLFPSTPS
ncbi:hypothetical protein CDL15_Pgr016386 [Punica granatum]|uniref:Secreted protein n=1 Tax=Punica granatum TaxID=22663 RepID=A0A218W6B9_PUNGR|nr:hypothetical protein CDL15_Pgr016386 [Punica granatum]